MVKISKMKCVDGEMNDSSPSLRIWFEMDGWVDGMERIDCVGFGRGEN